MKEIFQKRLFWMILVILLLAVFIYPPFTATVHKRYGGKLYGVMEREWGWIFSPPQQHDFYLFTTGDVYAMELDLKMLFAESIIAILLSIGVCLIPFGKKERKEV